MVLVDHESLVELVLYESELLAQKILQSTIESLAKQKAPKHLASLLSKNPNPYLQVGVQGL